jgi:hypothetical protein
MKITILWRSKTHDIKSDDIITGLWNSKSEYQKTELEYRRQTKTELEKSKY